jgi:hypothetical protein
VGIV